MSATNAVHIEAVDRRTGEAINITGVHPVADLFPRLEGDDFRELAESIRAVGLDQPIVLDGQGRILDGRNRFAACQEAGVKPEVVRYEGDDPDDYAVRTNITRRHLTTGARAILTEQARRLTGQSLREAGGTDLYHSRLKEAGTILDWAPDEVPTVLSGAAFSVAYDRAKARKAEATDRKRRLDRLTDAAPDLRQLVEEERMSLDDATAALESRETKALQEERATEQKARARMQEAQDAAGQLAATVGAVATIGIGIVAANENPALAERFLDGRPFVSRSDISKVRKALTELEKML